MLQPFMRYGAQPQGWIEWMALHMGKAPMPILDVMVGPLQARALTSAVEVGVFRALDEGAKTTTELAAACRCDQECLGLVLRIVRAMGYLELSQGQWRSSVLGRRHFGAKAPEPMSDYVAYSPAQWGWLDHLDEVLRTGRGIDFHQRQTPEQWTAYERAMVEHARSFAWLVAEKLPVAQGARRCLDIGGGHGLVGAEVCRRSPGMESWVLERPEALSVVRPLAKALGIDGLVHFCEGDLLVDDFAVTTSAGAPFDVALLCNVVHHFSAEVNVDLITRARRALRPGATIGIFDVEVAPEGAPAEAASDAFALYFRVTSTSTCFRGADYESWLVAAGFSEVRSVRSIKLPSRVLVTGRS